MTRSLDSVKEPDKWTSGKRSLLGPTHFGRGYHLHRARDLGGTANRVNVSLDILRTEHGLFLLPGRFKCVGRTFKLSLYGVAELFLLRDLL